MLMQQVLCWGAHNRLTSCCVRLCCCCCTLLPVLLAFTCSRVHSFSQAEGPSACRSWTGLSSTRLPLHQQLPPMQLLWMAPQPSAGASVSRPLALKEHLQVGGRYACCSACMLSSRPVVIWVFLRVP